MDLEGFEPCTVVDSTQLTDSTKRQKRSKRQFEVHGGYTDCCAGALGVFCFFCFLTWFARCGPDY